VTPSSSTIPTGLLSWASSDRGVVALANRQDLTTKKAHIVKLVNLWMQSTADTLPEM
jgi:hypothetical protein